MIRINDTIIHPEHIIAIELHATIFMEGPNKYVSGVKIYLLGLDIDKEIIMADGYWQREPKVLTYTGEWAESLRPWLAEMFPCEGRSIRLPEAVAMAGE